MRDEPLCRQETNMKTRKPHTLKLPGLETERRLTRLLGHRPKTAGEIQAELDREGWPNVDTSFMDGEESPNTELSGGDKH